MASSSACAPEGGVSCSPGGAGRDASDSRSDSSPRPDQRFPRHVRLTTRRQYRAVYAKGRRVGGRHITCFALPNSVGHGRLGITVTRKVGCAVQRNRVKRRLRELFRRNRDSPGFALDLVINARPGIVDARARELERDFLACLDRLTRRDR